MTSELGNAAIPDADSSASCRREGDLIAVVTYVRYSSQYLVHLRDLECHPPALAIVGRELDSALSLVLDTLACGCNELLPSLRSF